MKAEEVGATTRRSRRRGHILPGRELDGILLGVLDETDVPRSAYQLATRLHDVGHSLPAMTVYRALDRLVARGLVEKVKTRSAYRLRDEPKAVLLICDACGRTVSLAAPGEHDALFGLAGGIGFEVSHLAMEASGTCVACRAETTPRL
jgi:Fe2+ or Zn2+ uptake regulation protein